MKKNILVTGGSGQLGQCLKSVVTLKEQHFNYIFLNSKELDIADAHQLKAVFDHYKPVYCINCAAYTAVDQAEEDEQNAYKINTHAVKELALLCSERSCELIHISTDFVFEGSTGIPLKEDSPTQPVNAYGKSKLQGEQALESVLNQHYIIRTSWLYAEHATNFCMTMLKLAQIKDQLQVIYDQAGTPTYAFDLAHCIIEIINKEKDAPIKNYGTYHYSNEGVASWYDFAKAIFEYAKIDIVVMPVNSSAFATKATRPNYSVMDKAKIKNTFGIKIPYWRDSLNGCIDKI
jgi:dTDP-4-dehydrorhamnose reductase